MKISAPSYHSGPNMTPLVDVVMVLLIFLMLAGSFGTAEHAIVGVLPTRGIGRPNPRIDPLPVAIDVNVYRDGDATILGTPGRLHDPAEVRSALATRRAALIANGHTQDDVPVILHPVQATSWDHVIAVYDASVLAGFEKTSFAQAR